ncbi:MAG: (5-formylfuran-3-yl)methyl phosphate synthase [Promethearchaeota archaeon]
MSQNKTRIKVLISPRSYDEIIETLKGVPDIIDIKNPAEGSLGANFPWIIRSAKEELLKKIKENGVSEENTIKYDHVKVSAAIGDFPNLPGTASLAALGAAYAGADYIKVGLKGTPNIDAAIELSSSIVKAVKEFDSKKNVVIAGYADQIAEKLPIRPLDIPLIAEKSGADVAMLDTFNKNGTSIFDHLSIDDLKEFIADAHARNLKVAIAGALNFSHIPLIKQLNPDIIGVRSMVCENFDRVKGSINHKQIIKLKNLIM